MNVIEMREEADRLLQVARTMLIEHGHVLAIAEIEDDQGEFEFHGMPFKNDAEQKIMQEMIIQRAAQVHAQTVFIIVDTWTRSISPPPEVLEGGPDAVRAWNKKHFPGLRPKDSPNRREALCVWGFSKQDALYLQQHYRREGKEIIWEELDKDHALHHCGFDPWAERRALKNPNPTDPAVIASPRRKEEIS